MYDLRVVNINMIGKLPFENLNFMEIINKSRLVFRCYDDSKIRTSFPIDVLNQNGQQRMVEVAISTKGKIFMCGLTNEADGIKFFKIVKEELERILGKPLKHPKP